jgi:hypothetical protein
LVFPACAVAQSDCATFAKALNDRSDEVSKMEARVKALSPGQSGSCRAARDFVQSAEALSKFAEQGKSACEPKNMEQLAGITLRFNIAAAYARASAVAPDEVKRLCR